MWSSQPREPYSWLAPAVLSVFCCLPIAVPAIMFATRVKTQWAAGDHRGAEESAARAKQFTILAVSLGAIVIVVWYVAHLFVIPTTSWVPTVP